jgi:hypothetical protein
MPANIHGRSHRSGHGKTIIKDSTVQITLDDLTNLKPKKTILSFKSIFMHLLEYFKVRFNALAVG